MRPVTCAAVSARGSSAGGLAAAVLAAGLCLSPAPSMATPVTFEFTGTLLTVNAAVSSIFTTGAAFTVAVTIETATGDSSPGDPTSGLYVGSITSFIFTSGAQSIAMPLSAFSRDTSVSDYTDTFVDGVQFTTFEPTGLTGGPFNGYYAQTMNLEFNTFNNAQFTSDALPSEIDPADFEARHQLDIRLHNVDDQNDRFFLSGTILAGGAVDTDIQVPEPAGFALLALVATLLGAALRRRASLAAAGSAGAGAARSA